MLVSQTSKALKADTPIPWKEGEGGGQFPGEGFENDPGCLEGDERIRIGRGCEGQEIAEDKIRCR